MTEFVVLLDPESATGWLPSLVQLFVDAMHYDPWFNHERRPTARDAEKYWGVILRDLGEHRRIWLSHEGSHVLAAAQVLYRTDISSPSLHVVDLFAPEAGDHMGHAYRLFGMIERSVDSKVAYNRQTHFTVLHLG